MGGAVFKVTHVEGMLALLGSRLGGKGAARRCCMLDHSVGSWGTGSTTLYGAPTVSSTCSDHINTHWTLFGSFTAVMLPWALMDLSLRRHRFCPVTGCLRSLLWPQLSPVQPLLLSPKFGWNTDAAWLNSFVTFLLFYMQRKKKNKITNTIRIHLQEPQGAGYLEDPWNVEHFTL